MLKNISLLLLGVIVMLTVLMGFSNSSSDAVPRNSIDDKILNFDRDAIKVEFLKNALGTELTLSNPERLKIDGTVHVSILDPSGNVVTTNQQNILLNGDRKKMIRMTLPTSLGVDKLRTYRLKYTLKYGEENVNCKPNTKCAKKFNKVEGIKSIYACYNHLAVRLLAQSNFISGAPAAFRLVAFNPMNNEPVKNADVEVKLVSKKNSDETILFNGETNDVGTINASFEVPEDKEGGYDLKIKLAANIPEPAIEEINQPIQIKRDYKIMLSTDKPIYQPNQTIKLRALALNAGSLKPIGNKESTIEVYDAKGNKVFKKKTTTNNFGIISAEFTLADEVNMGNYKIKAIIDNIDSEKTVNVSRYVLPKFKVVFKTDKDYYLPSEVVKGSVDVNYFFGKSVRGGKVKIKVDKFDIGFSRIEDISGETDDNGHFDFEIKLPDSFVGQNIASGNAVVKFDIDVEDTAEHHEKKTSSVLVSQQPINTVVIPESGKLAKGIDNTVYVMTTYPDGTPAKTDVTVKIKDDTFTLHSDNTGISTFSFKPEEATVSLSVNASDTKGNKADSSHSLEADASEQSVLLRTDRAIARVGETVNIQTISTKGKGTVYIDMIKNGQTILTKSMDLKSGRAEMALDVPPELVGTIGINAYIIDESSEIIRDSKIVYINPAEDLVINVNADKQTYKPAEEAVIRFKVTDSNKHPILAALGVYVVDESVFALSELQPGLEKIFFTLEEEILKPRFEIHGITPSEIVKPVDEKIMANRQQEAAKVLFAAANDIKDYSVNVDTYEDGIHTMVNEYYNPMYTIISNIYNKFYKYQSAHKEYPKSKYGIEELIEQDILNVSDIIDPWGNRIVLIPINPNDRFYYDFYIISKGPDGKAGTADDIVMTQWSGMILGMDLKNPSALKVAFEYDKLNADQIKMISEASGQYNPHMLRKRGFIGRQAFAEGAMVNEMAAPGAAFDMAMPMVAKAAMPMDMKKDKERLQTSESASSVQEKSEVRVRDYFPETLYANAAVITDENGVASIKIPMADSITTWRLTAMGNSLNGLLGSTTSGIRVFQDFFVDIDLPVALTQNDKVSIPVAIYNYLPGKQTIKLELENEDWFECMTEMKKEVTLDSNEVSVEYFTIQVKKLGNHTLTVYGLGSSMSDAIKRTVRVEPDGEEFRDAINGRLEGNLTQTVSIPENAIDDANRILVKVYPGYLSQVVEGLDKIFRMPSGCFEQTSSSTYPNVLVLDYMKRTKQISPEIQMKAESYINSGYQRLLTFEVAGGGFDWFGNPPANKVLTAYGLMEFYDMSAVHDVDENLISRTQNWLVSKQESDGSWKPDEGGIAEGAINQYKGNTLRTTAYIGWALASSGYKGNALDNAVAYVKKNIGNADDAYTLAVIANLMVLVDSDDPMTDEAFTKLLKEKKEVKDVIYWEQKEKTPMYGGGESANIETTALATIALINWGKDVSATNKALNYLVNSKDSFGTWQTTQATILSMKALLMSLEDATAKINADVTVSINGKDIETYHIDENNSDVLKQFDLKNYTQKGKNNIDIKVNGQGSMLYQIVSIYYIPWELLPAPKKPMLSIDVEYDKTELTKNDTATATVTIQNNTPDTADMVIVDLGIPPGFQVMTEDLDKMVADKVITKYSIAARQIILYFDKIKGNDTVEFKYNVKAKISIKAKSGKSKVYKYYEPEVNDTAEPVEIKVI
ncbi:MAG: MG2 domain-containing protein [Cyanobacteriota bacterium]